MNEQAPEFMQFKVLNEPWNVWRLADGTILKFRFILMKIRLIKDAEGKVRGEISQSSLVVTEVPSNLRGPPDRDYRIEEISAAIVEDDIEKKVLRNEPGYYLLGNGALMMVRTEISKVGRSSLFGPDGEPKYKVDFRTEIAVMGPPPPTPRPTEP